MTSEPENKALETSILTHLSVRTLYRGDLIFPCIPAALEAYVNHLNHLFKNFGRSFSLEERDQIESLLESTMQRGFHQSPNAQIVVHYEIKGTANLQKDLACSVSLILPSLADQYEQWYRKSEDPTEASLSSSSSATAPISLFGQAPDAKIINLLEQVSDPHKAAVLDVGAGEGRNAIAIAQRGHPVHAVELTPEFTAALRQQAEHFQLALEITEGDILDPVVQLEAQHYSVVLLSEVVSHLQSVDQLRQLLVKLEAALAPQGHLLLNCFVAHEDYEPDDLAIQISQIAWSSIFTRSQLDRAIAGLPLRLMSDESTLTYEKNHLPPKDWPPTPWYEDWASGRSTFPFLENSPPMELRWLLFQKV